MMKRISVFITILSICFLFMSLTASAQAVAGEAGAAQADSTAAVHQFELKDNSVLIGRILSEDNTTIRMKTTSGIEFTIPKDQIKSRKNITDQMVGGELWGKDPNTTRLFFAPTGRPLKKGNGYFAVYEIFFPMLAYGITDFFTLAGGITLFPGADDQLFYVAPKIAFIRTEKFDLSAGVLYGNTIRGSGGGGIAYGVGTYGTDRNAFTLGLGYGFSGSDFAENPVILLGGDTQISRRFKLITENWIILRDNIVFYSFGVRFFGESLAADFGFFGVNRETSGFPFFPWLGFAYNFGK